MAEMKVTIDGATDATGAVVRPVPVAVTSTAGTASFVRITDGTNNVTVSASASVGNALAVSTGSVFAGTTLSAVTGNSTGAAVDAGSARSNWGGYCQSTGTLTGTATLELSFDGTVWVSSTATATVPAGGTIGVFSTGRAARYARVSLSGSTGSGTVTVNMMGAG